MAKDTAPISTPSNVLRFPALIPKPERTRYPTIEWTPRLHELVLGMYGLVLTLRNELEESGAPRRLRKLGADLERKHDQLTQCLVDLLEGGAR
ncbi:MAG: hypothetical protein AB1646_01410 [Thermodesulfobacteriota bacterium]